MSENIIREFDKKAKTPLYFYSALPILAGIVLFWFYWNKHNQKYKRDLVASPAAGDVYTIKQRKNDETTYYFLKIAAIRGDSVLAIQNHFDYGDFVNSLAQDDYFVKEDTITYKKKNLVEMLERDEIFSIDRDYSESDGFNRIR